MKTGVGVEEKDKVYSRASFSGQMLICFLLGEPDLLLRICVWILECFWAEYLRSTESWLQCLGLVQLPDFFTQAGWLANLTNFFFFGESRGNNDLRSNATNLFIYFFCLSLFNHTLGSSVGWWSIWLVIMPWPQN